MIGCNFCTAVGIPYAVVVVAFTSVGRGKENVPYTFFSYEGSPVRPPENITVERTDDDTVTVTWEPLSLFEARGFPVYTVTLTPEFNRRRRQTGDDGVIMVTTNQTNVVIKGLDPDVHYSLTVTVGTSSGEAVTPASMNYNTV